VITLYLIRHADAELNSFSGKDIDRNLSQKGLYQCVELKKQIQHKYWDEVDFYVSSSSRTQLTFNTIFNSSSCVITDELYLVSSQKLLLYINNLKSSKPICIVSHNEGISELASYLVGQRILMNTASFLELSFDFESSDYISKDTANVVNFIS
jgi:phosphohistidine phosphatase